MTASTIYFFLGFFSLFAKAIVFGQVCSPIGNICTATVDCCKGCCEAHICVDRSFSCSIDMIAQPGYETCSRFYCPPESICYLRETCPPENPCPRMPSCRKVDFSRNYTNYPYYRNSSPGRVLPLDLYLPAFLAFTILLSTFTKFV